MFIPSLAISPQAWNQDCHAGMAVKGGVCSPVKMHAALMCKFSRLQLCLACILKGLRLTQKLMKMWQYEIMTNIREFIAERVVIRLQDMAKLLTLFCYQSCHLAGYHLIQTQMTTI